MRKFTELSKADQQSIDNRYKLPKDRSKLLVSEIGQPIEIISGAKFTCQLKHSALICGGHHNHEVRVNS